MPEPSPQHDKLRALVGDWVGEETLHPSPWSPQTRHATGHFRCRMGIDGMFLLNDYEERRDGEVFFRGHGVYGWDAGRERYTMYWFDSMGHNPNETLGVWDGDTLSFSNRGEQGHARYSYILHADGRMGFRIDASRDGQEWSCMMEGIYTRRSA